MFLRIEKIHHGDTAYRGIYVRVSVRKMERLPHLMRSGCRAMTDNAVIRKHTPKFPYNTITTRVTRSVDSRSQFISANEKGPQRA